MLPVKFTSGATITFCKKCNKIKRHGEWVFLSSLQITLLGKVSDLTILDEFCPDCRVGEVYEGGGIA